MDNDRRSVKGFEVMRMIRKGQCLPLESGPTEEVRFVNRLALRLLKPSADFRLTLVIRILKL